MRDQRVRTERKCAGGLNRVRERQFQGGAKSSGEHLGKGDGGYRKTYETLVVSLEHGYEYRCEARMVLEHLDDGRGVDEQQSILRQSLQTHRSHSSLKSRKAAVSNSGN